MASNNLIGYAGGLAIAVGVGAAVFVGSQATAQADTGAPGAADTSGSTPDMDTGHKTPQTKTATESVYPVSMDEDSSKDGDRVTSSGVRIADYDAAQVETLRDLYRSNRPKVKPEPAGEGVVATEADDETTPSAHEQAVATVDPVSVPETSTSTEVQLPASGRTTDTSEFSTLPPAANFSGPSEANGSTVTGSTSDAAAYFAWNPFNPMPPEPAPNDMPGVVWNVEQALLNLFSGIPDLAPFPREGLELAYRISQMVPFLNLVIPFSNVFADLPAALAGDKNASQRMVNNLVITVQPVAIAYYGYNQIADLVNLEQLALNIQSALFAAAWTVLDPFQLLHNAGAWGLPLSTTTPPPYPPTTQTVTLATAEADPSASVDPTQPNPLSPVAARAIDAPPAVRTTETATTG